MARVEITMCDFCGAVKESEECKSLSIKTKTTGSPLAKYSGDSWNDDLVSFPDICPECYTKFSESLCDLLDTLNIKTKQN